MTYPSSRAWGIGVVFALTSFAPIASAEPSGPMLFCAQYGGDPVCQGQLPTCDFCHTTAFPTNWNAYGVSLFAPLAGGAFAENLGVALAAVEGADADGDGISNIDEIRQGTLPGDATSFFVPIPAQVDVPEHPVWALGA